VLLAAVQHGAVNAWNGYIDVYRGNFGNILVYMAVSLIVSTVVVLLAGPSNLSRTNQRNIIDLTDRERPEAGQVIQQA
jgi:hypothetical protein